MGFQRCGGRRGCKRFGREGSTSLRSAMYMMVIVRRCNRSDCREVYDQEVAVRIRYGQYSQSACKCVSKPQCSPEKKKDPVNSSSSKPSNAILSTIYSTSTPHKPQAPMQQNRDSLPRLCEPVSACVPLVSTLWRAGQLIHLPS